MLYEESNTGSQCYLVVLTSDVIAYNVDLVLVVEFAWRAAQ